MTDGTETTGERLRAILAATAAAGGEAQAQALGRVIAVGWATVELDRAAEELAGALGSQPSSFGRAAGSEALGAHARIAPGVLDGGAALVLLEPSTEGRLAAHLARHGEGPVAVWHEAAGAGDPAPSSATPLEPSSPGPFGPERAVRAPAGDTGPYRFIVGPGTGTIRP
jgi:hypothetical protein